MRSAFINALVNLASRDRRIVLIVGDLGFGVVEPFAQQFPDRFVNVGIAEQNMTGIAAGMALSGQVVFTYSIGNFPTLRCLEQIRDDVCYHRAAVKIVSVGGGLAYGALGPSHHATEDIAIMRALPEMIVLAPGDPFETTMATEALVNCPGPAYLRLGRAGESTLHSPNADFSIGRAIQLTEGEDIALVSTGTMLHDSRTAVEILAQQGIHARLLSMHTIKPIDESAILSAARETSAILTVEEHGTIGGLGGAVAEVLAEHPEVSISFKRLGLPSAFTSLVGDQSFLKRSYGLSPEGIATAAAELCARACTMRATARAISL